MLSCYAHGITELKRVYLSSMCISGTDKLGMAIKKGGLTESVANLPWERQSIAREATIVNRCSVDPSCIRKTHCGNGILRDCRCKNFFFLKKKSKIKMIALQTTPCRTRVFVIVYGPFLT